MPVAPCIAVVGKGGVGKTTVSAFIIRYLLEAGVRPILAVDADPSVSLGGVLGVEVTETIGGIREDTRSVAGGMPEGIPKQDYLALKVEEAITEANGFDLLTMGRPEGPGCYCFVNNVLRDHLDKLTRRYKATVIDCEAGMEHLSRRTSRDVDTLVMVADPTIKALETLKTSLGIARQINNKIIRKLLVINRVPIGRENEVSGFVSKHLDSTQFDAMAILPQDEAIFEAELAGKSLLTINSKAPSYQVFRQFVQTLQPALYA
ncbi:MAG: AAA family ATPase [bacterium]|nr:AAA family ATPase [bacterium]